MQGYSGTSWWNGGQYDATQDWLTGFNAQNGYGAGNRDLNAGRSNAFYDLLRGGGSMDPRTWYARAGDLADRSMGMAAGLSKALGASPLERTAALASVLPGMQDIAGRMTAGAMGDNGSSLEDMARAASSRGRRQAEGSATRAGGMTTGARSQMIVDAASEPLLAAVQRLGELRAQTYQGAMNPLMEGAAGAIDRKASDYANGLGAISSAQQPLLGAGQGLAGLLGDQSNQAFLTPQIMQRTGFGEQLGSALLSGALGAATGGLGSGLLAGLGDGANDLLLKLFRPASGIGEGLPSSMSFFGSHGPLATPDLFDPASWLSGPNPWAQTPKINWNTAMNHTWG